MFDLLQYGDQPCLAGDGRAYSYAQVHAAVETLRPGFSGRNLVLCLCENTLPSLLGYIACVNHGQVALLLAASQDAASVQAIVEQYRPEYAWLAEARSASLPGAAVAARLDGYVLLKLPAAAAPAPMDERLQLLLTTSGSTGSSKLVRITRANLAANAASIIAYLGIRASDVAVTTLPFSYSFGLSIINSHLMAGASIQLTELNPLSREFWTLVQETGVTSLSGVPYTYEMLRRIKFERFDLDAIRYLAQAGGRMSQQGLDYLLRLSKEKGWPCYVMYGQTEATARMSYLPPAWLEHKLGSIGHAIPHGHFDIVDEAGQLVDAPGVPGELVYSGPNVSLGYASSRADLARGDDWHGRLHTGDVGYRDADGCYFITGRLKRFIKVFGNRVSLDEVEALLQAEFPAADFICHGQDDALRIGCAGMAEPAAVLAFAARRLGIHRSAIQCKLLEAIPRLSNGKVNYNALTDGGPY